MSVHFPAGEAVIITDMELAESVREQMGYDFVDCSQCENVNVQLTGTVEADGHNGLFLGYKCRCGNESHCGDGDFFNFYEMDDHGNIEPKEPIDRVIRAATHLPFTLLIL